MNTLAHQLGETPHCSLLLRKAERLRLGDLDALLALAVARGAKHYAGVFPSSVSDPGEAALSQEELVVLLLLGSHRCEPFAVRVAAQLASRCDPVRLARLAILERAARPLAYIARAGRQRDPERRDFWTALLTGLGTVADIPAGRLPHWSRFVSQSGVTRSGAPRVDWLHAAP